jgi:hypothetical protein
MIAVYPNEKHWDPYYPMNMTFGKFPYFSLA